MFHNSLQPETQHHTIPVLNLFQKSFISTNPKLCLHGQSIILLTDEANKKWTIFVSQSTFSNIHAMSAVLWGKPIRSIRSKLKDLFSKYCPVVGFVFLCSPMYDCMFATHFQEYLIILYYTVTFNLVQLQKKDVPSVPFNSVILQYTYT